jgi:hypothetical protein
LSASVVFHLDRRQFRAWLCDIAHERGREALDKPFAAEDERAAAAEPSREPGHDPWLDDPALAWRERNVHRVDAARL